MISVSQLSIFLCYDWSSPNLMSEKDGTSCIFKQASKGDFPFPFHAFSPVLSLPVIWHYCQYLVLCSILKLQNSELHCSCQYFFSWYPIHISSPLSTFLLSPIYCNIFSHNVLQASELRGLLPGRLCILVECNNLEYDHSPDHKRWLQTDVLDS